MHSQPLPDQQFQLTIQTKGRLTSVEEFGNVVIRANPDGSFVRVRDVAKVELAAKTLESSGRLDGSPAAVIGVYQSPGGNAINSADRIRSTLDRLKAAFPPGVDYKITYDTTIFVKESISGVLHTLFEAFALVVIVVFLFLGNLRATLIPLIAVPVSLIGTFAVMLALGFSANTVSLLALVLAIGIVVDDAIVVVEAVEAHLEKDHTIYTCGSGAPRDERDHRADHRHHLGAAVGVCAGRVHSRYFGRAVPAVRGRGLGLDDHLGAQRADPVAGALRGLPDAEPRPQTRADRLCAARHRPGA